MFNRLPAYIRKYDTSIFLILILVTLVNLLNFVYQKKEIYTQKFDTKKYQVLYEHSQYNVLANEYWGNIADPELYSLAGYKYLNLVDPSSINYELQPLTKYLFGVSVYIFGNANVAQLILGTLVLVTTYFSARFLFQQKSISLIPSAILSFDLLFKEQISQVYLDLFLTLTLLSFFILVYLSLKTPKIMPLALFCLGVVSLSKSFFIGIIAFTTGFAFLFFIKENFLKHYLINTIWALTAYILGYLVFFFYHNIYDFLLLHIRIMKLYKSYVPEYPKGEIFRIILTGNWREWWGDFGLTHVNYWTLLWPLGLLATVVSLFGIIKKINRFALLHILWIFLYLIVSSFKLVFPRYLLPVLPSMYILLVFSIYNVIRRVKYGYWNGWE